MPPRVRRYSPLAARRRAMGYSQEKLAEDLVVDRATVARWERGDTEPQPSLRPRLAETLKMSLDELAQLLDLQTVQADVPGVLRPFPNEDKGSVSNGSTIEPITDAYIRSIHRRIEALLGLDHRMGGRQSAPLAVQQFEEVHQKIGSSPVSESNRADLYAAVGELAEVAGWFLYEAADHAASRRMNFEALTLTQLAGNRSVELLILQNMAMNAGHVGRPTEALHIARSVLESPLSPTVEALFRFREALTLAQMGREQEARRALKMAVALRSDGIRDTDPAWVWWVDDRQVSWYQGKVEGDLKNAGRSIEKLAEAVQFTPYDQTRSRYYHLADLMRAQVVFGAYSDAERTAFEVTEFNGAIKSGLVSEIFRNALISAEQGPDRAKGLWQRYVTG